VCCKSETTPLIPDVAETILAIGQFVPNDEGTAFYRDVGESRVTAYLTGDKLTLSITPAVSIDSHHEGKREAASVYFEIAARYAQRVNGQIKQCSTIQTCGQERERVIAQYPELPLAFSSVCPGFRRTFTGVEGEEG
jgi:hypothetical protein